MNRVLIIGLGEVGKAIYYIFKNSMKYEVYGYDTDPNKTVDRYEEIPHSIDFLHIAFPYSNNFVNLVCEYVKCFKPKVVIIHSTIAPGTTREVFKKTNITTAFSPVRGKHPNLVKHLHFWPKWVVTLPMEKAGEVANHLSIAGFKVKIYNGSPESVELAKLWETVYRAIMIASWHEIHRIAKIYKAEIEAIAEFVGEVHEVLGDRPIYYPDYIGGHCLIPNTRILSEVYSSKLFEFVLESNELRLKELSYDDVRKDIEMVKKIASRFVNKEYYT